MYWPHPQLAPSGSRCFAYGEVRLSVNRLAQASGDLISPQRMFVWGLIESTRAERLPGGLVPVDVPDGAVLCTGHTRGSRPAAHGASPTAKSGYL